MAKNKIAEELAEELSFLKIEDRMSLISNRFKASVFTTSLGMEDQLLTWAAATQAKTIQIVTLQTGRLFEETNSLIKLTQERYGVLIKEHTPEENALGDYIKEYGENGFYDSLEARKLCCEVRKVRPLNTALKNADAWITGLRRGQSNNRKEVPMVQWDPTRNLMKINPLADWSLADIKATIEKFDIPINPLHSKNYPSIGCEPCTRAINPGEPERAGRWWWEQDNKQECGLHVPEILSIKNQTDNKVNTGQYDAQKT